MWKAIIVDEEPLAILELNRLLNEFSQILVVGQANSVPNAKTIIERLKPDLVFLDIDLGTQSGFDLLEKTEWNYHTIFVTEHEKFAIRAFELNAHDYLLKPVQPNRLKESIMRLGNPYKLEKKINFEPFDKILISNRNSSQFVTVSSINHIEAMGDYTKVYVNENFIGLVHQTMKRWLERLPEELFFQVHRSYIVNINGIKRIYKKSTSSYEVQYDHFQIPISKNYFKKVKEKFRVD